MKTKTVLATLVCSFVMALSACGNNPKGTVFPIPPDADIKDLRFITDEEKTVDFSKATSIEDNNFRLAHGYSNNGVFNCNWSRDAAKLEDNVLKLSVFKGNERYYGAEYRARRNEFSYGYYATKMKASNCPGIVSSFFTYVGYPAWHEIDIEFLGKNTRQVQFNYFYDGIGDHDFLYNLWFDAAEDFHEYGFEWLEDSITWYIDGYKVYQATESIPYHPQMLMMNVWNTIGRDDWTGALDDNKLPTCAQYQWIAYIPAN